MISIFCCLLRCSLTLSCKESLLNRVNPLTLIFLYLVNSVQQIGFCFLIFTLVLSLYLKFLLQELVEVDSIEARQDADLVRVKSLFLSD